MKKNLFSWYNFGIFLLIVLGLFIATFLSAILIRAADVYAEREDIYSSNALFHRLVAAIITAFLLILFYRLFWKKIK